ncbi:ABC transporter permease [Actinophytocola algeriensis]|uniref:Ribose transport system permease protein n=1 Tax=Actinophytocola algeriensis TaxID=1768010 RepID=A0A7W7Q002_9PSEU|nr:ABC transporter permease [Actinophytocola algeriensis]MBB4904480.1 ribose transport system permease protein [Actinophytocola algeriensis]MBE1476661.1 ribose transport system permease protein [Actinophytocola algeriensis]
MTTDIKAPQARRRTDTRIWLRDNGVYVAIAVLVVYNLAFTENFATLANLNTQLVQVAPVLIVALGMALVIGTEGVDLSVGSVMAIAAATLPLYLGYGLFPALALALVAGALCGMANGTLVAVVGIQPIVATLALLVGGRGLALVFADGQLKDIRNPEMLELGAGKALGIPYIVLIAALLSVLVWLLVRYTTFGRQLVAIGGNRSASALAGLPVRRVLMLTYVISGVLAAIAGVLATARLTASDPSAIGNLFELSAITAVVVGGTPLSGGRVRILGTVAGAVLMQLIAATLIKHDLPDSTAQIVQAAIIVVAVYLQRSRSAGVA